MLLFAFLFALPMFAQSCIHTTTQFNCVKYVRNYDADTATFNISNVHPLIGKKVNARFKGVDTPELRTKDPCEKKKARIAKRFVKNILKNAKRINLEEVERDKYFRILSKVTADGKNIAELLIKNKLGYEYHGGKKPKVDWCKR